MPQKFTIIDLLMGVTVALTWGMGFVFAKAAIEHFPPILLMTCRFTVTALALVWFVKPPTGQMRALIAVAFVSAAIQYSLTFSGLKGLDAGVAALVVQLEVPFLVLIGMIWLSEKPGLRKWIGIAAAFVGVAIITGEPKVADAWVSVLLVIGGAFFWAIGQGMIRSLKNISGMTVAAWVAVFAVPQLAMMSLIFETGQVEAITKASLLVWSAVIYLGLVMTAFGYGIWYTLVRKHPISHIAPFLLLLPVFSIIGGVVFLGETLSWISILGGSIVIAGVAFILLEDIR